MAGEWKEVSISDIAERIAMGPFGSDIKTDNFVESGVPIIRGGNLTTGRFNGDSFVYLTEEKANQLSNANAFPGDIVFTHRGTLGQVGLLPNAPYNRYIVSQSQMKLTCNKKLADSVFIYYFFKSPQGQQALLMNTSQTGVPAISRPVTSLKAIRLLLPPLPEQKRIAHILGTLDDKIELNRRMNKTLEEMARALFKSWFIDFEPVVAKSEGRQPEGMDAATAKLFPSSFEDSVLGRVPKGWPVGRLDDLLTLQRGFDLPATERTKGKYPVMAASGHNGCHNKFMVCGPGITTGRSGVLGKVFFIHGDFWPLNTSLWVKEFKRISPAYAFHLLRNLDFALFNAGSAVPTLNRNHVHNLPVVMPPKLIVEKFDAQVMLWMKQQTANENQTSGLTALRGTMLPKLLSGKLSVVNATHTIGANL